MSVTTGLDGWRSAEGFVERNMDLHALTGPTPDESLVLAGPARYRAAEDFTASLLSLGGIMSFSVQKQASSNPVPTTGSGRLAESRGRAMYSWSLQRLDMADRNAIRALYTSVIQASGIDPATFPERPGAMGTSSNFENFDSELLYIPFGLMVIKGNKARRTVSMRYLEACHITSESDGWQAGSSTMVLSVSGWCDRIISLVSDAGVPDKAFYGAGNFSALNALLGIERNAETPDLTTK